MALIKPSILLLLLFALLMGILPSGLAAARIPVLGLQSSPSQFPSLETFQQCWVSMEEMVGCYSEVYRSFISGKEGLSTIGPSCCMANNDITSNCWSQMFPNTPAIPTLLNNYCATYQTGQGDAPSPSVEPADLN
ncbi:putative Egg cell-secreted protein 1.2/1.3/1.4 [Helianthus debilis subsp. tardiflorus]